MNDTRPRPLDFVLTPEGQTAIVTEVSAQLPDDHGYTHEKCLAYLREHAETGDYCRSYAIEIIGPNEPCERVAWYSPDELEVLDSLPRLLAKCLESSHSDGDGFREHYFGELKKPSHHDNVKKAGLYR